MEVDPQSVALGFSIFMAVFWVGCLYVLIYKVWRKK